MMTRVVIVLFALCIIPAPLSAEVIFDNAVSVTGTSVTSLTTPSFTITASANRAALLALLMYGNNATSITSTCGGVSGAAVTGSDSGAALNSRALQHVVIAPASGSQTASMSWTTAVEGHLGVITASGVDQTTPANNGTFATGATGQETVSITSTNGDLTVAASTFGGTPAGSTQTQRWVITTGSSINSAGSTGPGTGSATHTWDDVFSEWAATGANFVQATGGGGNPNQLPLRGAGK